MNNNGSDPSKFTPLVWFLMGSGVSLFLILGGWGLWLLTGGNESLDSVNVSLISSEDEAQVANQLRGHWELETLNDEMPLFLFFTERNSLVVGDSENQGNEVGYYNIESDDRVNYLFLIDPEPGVSNQFLIAFFDFPEQEKLRIDFGFFDPYDPPTSRPSTSPDFSDEAVVYEKVSTVISDNIDITSLEQQGARAMQVEAKNVVGAVMRQQQAHRLEHGAFARDFEELRTGLPSETETYTYTVETGEDYTKIRAIPVGDKQNFLSAYTAAVFVTPTGQTRVQACQTAEPSGTAPGVSFIGGEVQCDGTAIPMR